MNLYASSLELWRVRTDAVFQRVSSLIHERRDDNGIDLQPLGWCREGDFLESVSRRQWYQQDAVFCVT